jgi:hypothetical protein
MSSSRWERLAPLTGIVFVVFAVVAAILSGSTPDPNDSTAGVAGFWQVHDTRELWSSYIGALGVVFFLWFVGSLRAALRRYEGEPGRLAGTAFAGFIVFAVGLLALLGTQFAAADVADDSGVAPQVVGTLSVLQSDLFFPLTIGLAVGVIATGLAILRFAGLPGWLGWVSIVIGVITLTPVGFFGFLAAILWIVIVSVMLYLRGTEAAAPPTVTTTAPPTTTGP